VHSESSSENAYTIQPTTVSAGPYSLKITEPGCRIRNERDVFAERASPPRMKRLSDADFSSPFSVRLSAISRWAGVNFAISVPDVRTCSTSVVGSMPLGMIDMYSPETRGRNMLVTVRSNDMDV